MTRAEPSVRGILVTFRRPAQVCSMLNALAAQSRPLDDLVVVDNEPTPETREIVRSTAPTAKYVPAPENLGPAGGISLGMRRLLERSSEGDWIMTLDDDDPPRDAATFSRLFEFARDMAARDPRTAAVGLAGARFDRRRGRVVRIGDDELRGAVPVDYIGGNQFPTYSVAAVRSVGPFRDDLFFGFEELEFGLRLRDAGYTLYCDGATWHERRGIYERLGQRGRPSRTLGDVEWRRYYALRNLIRILRDSGATSAAVRVTLTIGIAKPIANAPRGLRLAREHLRQNMRACRDAWTGRLGRTMQPT